MWHYSSDKCSGLRKHSILLFDYLIVRTKKRRALKMDYDEIMRFFKSPDYEIKYLEAKASNSCIFFRDATD